MLYSPDFPSDGFSLDWIGYSVTVGKPLRTCVGRSHRSKTRANWNFTARDRINGKKKYFAVDLVFYLSSYSGFINQSFYFATLEDGQTMGKRIRSSKIRIQLTDVEMMPGD